MRLKHLIIKNFKNLKNFQLDFTGPLNFEFMAKNAFGKTSIADAIFWVMTGKLLGGSSDIMSIKPKDNTSLLVSVELLFEDGTSIMKTYQENWVKTRGTTEKRLEGHTTNCFINGVNIPVTKFDESLRELFKINYEGKWNGNIFQLLIDPLYFGVKETWQERRKLVIDLVGDVTDDDVLATDNKLEPLRKYLYQANGKFEDVKKVLNHNLKKLNEEEKKLNAQIEILTTEQTIQVERYNAAIKRIEEIEKSIQELHNKKFQAQKDLIAERNEQVASLKNKLAELKELDNKNYQKSIEKQQLELKTLRDEKAKVETEQTEIVNKINKLEQKKRDCIYEQHRLLQTINTNEEEMSLLRKKWADLNEKAFEATDSLICPNCGHDLHGDLVEQKRKEFNLRKTQELEEITRMGQHLKSINEEREQELKEVKEQEESLAIQSQDLSPKVSEYNAKIIELNNKELALNKSIPEFKYSSDTLKLEQEIKELENKPYPVVADELEIDKKVGTLQVEKHQVQKVIDTYNAEQLNIQKANELEKQLNEVINNIAEFESLQMMLSDFIKTKLELLNEKVATVFGDIKFQLVESNIKEGSWNEVCWVLDGDIPYHNTNSAAKIRVGIAVCEAIKKKLNVEGLFYLIDNGEQITDRDFSKLTNTQTISFVAFDVEPNQKEKEPEQINLFSL